MERIVLCGSGVYTPPQSISNDELVDSFNSYVRSYNRCHAAAIDRGVQTPLQESSAEFIEKASGIRSRHVLDREGILDPERMCPRLPERGRDEMSMQCEIGLEAAVEAMERGGVPAGTIDAVIVSCSNYERPYPAIAAEIQQALGIEGFAFDMNIACSSATFALQTAVDSIYRGNARAVLVVSPEICSGHLNFRDRDSHFIFGDVATAFLVAREDCCQTAHRFEVVGTRLLTRYSTNIYNGSGFLDRTRPPREDACRLFTQEGRKVFKEVVPIASEHILSHLRQHGMTPAGLRRVWLHQANLNMNRLIARKLLGDDVAEDVTPTILESYANTAAAGSVICFHRHHEDMRAGDVGLLCSFGAGYSVGSAILRKLETA